MLCIYVWTFIDLVEWRHLGSTHYYSTVRQLCCPCRSALRKLILGAGGVASPKLHDIVVIGLQVWHMKHYFPTVDFFLCACVSQEMVPLNVTNVVLSDSVIHYSDQASILRSQFLFLIIHSNYVFEGRKFTNSPIFCECHSYAGGVKTCKQVEQKHRKSPQFHHWDLLPCWGKGLVH